MNFEFGLASFHDKNSVQIPRLILKLLFEFSLAFLELY